MKRYIFTERNNRGSISGNIYRIKDNDIHFITDYKASTASRRGGVHDAFNALMDCGEIPRKYEKSSSDYGSGWMGSGYFYGEVTKHYDIKEAY
jgi:hypothetical protein